MNSYSNVLTKYCAEILQSTKYLNFRGIPLPKDQHGLPISLKIPLNKIFIQLQVVPHENIMQTQDNLLAQGEFETLNQSNQPIGIQQAIYLYKNIIILGGPGSGKSTLIRWLASFWCERNEYINN